MESLILKINAKTYFFPIPWYDSRKEKRKKKKKEKKKREENAGEACLKRWLQIFEKRTNRKWHERKNSLENKLT